MNECIIILKNNNNRIAEFKRLFIYFEREREQKWGRERDCQVDSTLSTEPNTGLIPMTMR